MSGASGRILFVTGTDTGVGKTLLTGLLLYHLRRRGCHALAMKPFASGSRADARFLRGLMEDELPLDEINPYYFTAPLAPLAAARKRQESPVLGEVVRKILRTARHCECLLVEGIGGLMVPVGRGNTVLDLIVKLGCEVVVVGRNKLGTINHTVLTAEALQHAGVNRLTTVLMGVRERDLSARTNVLVLREMLSPRRVYELPFLGRRPEVLGAVKEAEKKFKKTLALISK